MIFFFFLAVIPNLKLNPNWKFMLLINGRTDFIYGRNIFNIHIHSK